MRIKPFTSLKNLIQFLDTAVDPNPDHDEDGSLLADRKEFLFLGAGAYKVVYLTKIKQKYVVVKIGHWGSLSDEIKNWKKSIRLKCSKGLAKIIAHSKKRIWIVAEHIDCERIRNIHVDELYSCIEILEKHSKIPTKLKNYEDASKAILKLNISDIHEANLGFRKKQLVVVDYSDD